MNFNFNSNFNFPLIKDKILQKENLYRQIFFLQLSYPPIHKKRIISDDSLAYLWKHSFWHCDHLAIKLFDVWGLQYTYWSLCHQVIWHMKPPIHVLAIKSSSYLTSEATNTPGFRYFPTCSGTNGMERKLLSQALLILVANKWIRTCNARPLQGRNTRQTYASILTKRNT